MCYFKWGKGVNAESKIINPSVSYNVTSQEFSFKTYLKCSHTAKGISTVIEFIKDSYIVVLQGKDLIYQHFKY